MTPFQSDEVKEKFESYPPVFRTKLLELRELIFKVAKANPEIGPIEEVLRWKEPAYLTTKTQSGSCIRMDYKPSKPGQYFLFFHCQTTLIEDIEDRYGDLFEYEGNRALIFTEGERIPKKEVQDCISMALTYKLNKKSRYA